MTEPDAVAQPSEPPAPTSSSPASSFDRELERRLGDLATRDLLRRLETPRGLDFTSNDYLGLGSDPRLGEGIHRRLEELARRGRLTSPASRLLRGTTEEHLALEERLARYKGAAAALLFPSGYQANVGVLSALVGSRDRVLSDALNHASIIDGIRLAQPRRKVIYPHLEVDAVEEALAQPHPEGQTFLVTESLFSMDGDIAPLERYAELCEAHGAVLVVDDAHATGLYGERGSGLAEALGVTDRATVVLSTLGKSFALAGAFVAGSRTLKEYLVNRSRSFIFSTAAPPLFLASVSAALDLLEAEPRRGRPALELADRLRRHLVAAGAPVGPPPGTAPGHQGLPEGPIVPVVLGASRRALEIARALQDQGFDVRAVRPPTVPPRTARLRISVHADHRPADIDRLAEALIAELGPEESQPSAPSSEETRHAASGGSP